MRPAALLAFLLLAGSASAAPSVQERKLQSARESYGKPVTGVYGQARAQVLGERTLPQQRAILADKAGFARAMRETVAGIKSNRVEHARVNTLRFDNTMRAIHMEQRSWDERQAREASGGRISFEELTAQHEAVNKIRDKALEHEKQAIYLPTDRATRPEGFRATRITVRKQALREVVGGRSTADARALLHSPRELKVALAPAIARIKRDGAQRMQLVREIGRLSRQASELSKSGAGFDAVKKVYEQMYEKQDRLTELSR
jgi:hypothetical protein